MRILICFAVLLTISAARGHAQVVLSCAGEAGLRGYHVIYNDKTRHLEMSMYSLLSESDEVWIRRTPADMRIREDGERATFQIRVSPMGLHFEIDNTEPPVFAVRQFGIRLMTDQCEATAMLWRPEILLAALERPADQDPERRTIVQLPPSSE